MITEEFKKKFSEFVEKFERKELKLYDDGHGVPTIGIGFALINKISEGNWRAHDKDFLRGKGINITDDQYKIIAQYADLKSKGKSTADLKKKLDAFNLTITNDTAVALCAYSIEDKYNKKIIAKNSIGEKIWDNLSIARQIAIMDHAYQRGNIDNLKNDIIAGDFKKVAETIRKSTTDSSIKARFDLRAKMIEEDKFIFENIHIVKPNEKFGDIAKQYNISVAELQKLNPQIADINKISIGQMINIPITYEDIFITHEKELNTVLGQNEAFKHIFNTYKYDSFLNIYYNNASAQYKGQEESTSITPSPANGYFYIGIQVANHPFEYYSMHRINRNSHDAHTKPLVTYEDREPSPHSVTLPHAYPMSENPPLIVKRIGLNEMQYRLARGYANEVSEGEYSFRVYPVTKQDSIDFVQTVYNKAQLPLHFSTLYSSSELSNLPGQYAAKLLMQYGSKDTMENSFSKISANNADEIALKFNVPANLVKKTSDTSGSFFNISVNDVSLPQDLTKVVPITSHQWISDLNNELYKNFTPNPLMPAISLTSEMLNFRETNTIEFFYMPINDQRQAVTMLKMMEEKGVTLDKLPQKFREVQAFINFIKFNDVVRFLNRKVETVKIELNSLLNKATDKSSDKYLTLTQSVNNMITALENEVEQFTVAKAHKFEYWKEILNSNNDTVKLYHNIKLQEKKCVKEIESLLPSNQTI